jgi:predicted Zn-dependent protease with MMP-like domain
MQVEELEASAQKFMMGLPDQVIDALEDVELMVAASPELARAVLLKEYEDEFDASELPDDCKGVFVGAPTEIEAGETTDSEEEEIVYYPEGFIVLIANNIPDEQEGLLVLMHEIGHALGMDEDEVKNLGLGVAPPEAPKEGATDVPANSGT